MSKENIAIGDRFNCPAFGGVEVVDIFSSATSGESVFRVKDKDGVLFLADKEELTAPPEAL